MNAKLIHYDQCYHNEHQINSSLQNTQSTTHLLYLLTKIQGGQSSPNNWRRSQVPLTGRLMRNLAHGHGFQPPAPVHGLVLNTDREHGQPQPAGEPATSSTRYSLVYKEPAATLPFSEADRSMNSRLCPFYRIIRNTPNKSAPIPQSSASPV